MPLRKSVNIVPAALSPVPPGSPRPRHSSRGLAHARLELHERLAAGLAELAEVGHAAVEILGTVPAAQLGQPLARARLRRGEDVAVEQEAADLRSARNASASSFA